MGCGAIGCKVAKVASFGFGVNVIGYDIAKLDPEKMKKDFGIMELLDSIDAGLNKADFVSIHLPATESTRHFVGAQFLSQMQSSACLINTSRGAVLDEAALYDALKSGQIAGAALDCFVSESLTGSPLLELDNIVMTPHIGMHTSESIERVGMAAAQNVVNTLSGREPLSRVQP